MANWEKLNKEFDEALDSMTKEDWKSWYERFKQKQINQNRMKSERIKAIILLVLVILLSVTSVAFLPKQVIYWLGCIQIGVFFGWLASKNL